MDRFKFRGRRIDNGELVYGSLLRNEFGWNIVTFESVLVDPDTNSHDLEMILVGIVDGSQEQCTGLKDKNGVLIFEGDTLGYADGRRFYIRYGQQQPVEEYCGFMIVPVIHSGSGMSDSFPSLLYMGCFKTAEVIGNIHENPELLEHK